jgi:signal transduction histidine kinase
MPVYPSSRMQAERTIAAGRVVLAAACLFAVWMDPAEPARFAQVTYGLHWVYVTYALLLAGGTWRWHGGSRLPLITHIIDIVVFSVFQYLTLGPSSPFFVYFVFSVFCGAVRWGWRGTLSTASVVIVAYVLMGTSMSRTLGPVENEWNRIIIRMVYLVVSAGMLVYLGLYEERLRQGIERLAHWPVVAGKSTERAVAEIIEHAASIVGAGRVLVVWEVGEEPDVHAASWSAGTLSLTKHSPGDLTPLLPEALDQATFLSIGDVNAGSTILVNEADGRLIEQSGLPLCPAALDMLHGTGLASAPFQTDRVAGRVFFTDLGTPTAEVVPLSEVVSREIGASLDQMHVTRRLHAIGAGEERIRLARDLHDGVLQSLTGIRFELRALQQAVQNGDESVIGRLHALERALAMEQRELRYFIGDLKPAISPAPATADDSLAVRLDDLRERLALEWKTPVSIRVAPAARPSSSELAQAVPLMVHEAVVNAMKHAHPTRVAVNVDVADGYLRIIVRDDGHGFDFNGRQDHAALDASRSAPRSLFDRVTALGGRMSIDSSPEGSQVEMVLSL